jgi:hypothetical protein
VVTPVLAVPSVAAIVRDKLDGWRCIEFDRARLQQKRGRLCRDGGQNYSAHKGQDYGAHISSKRTLG